MFTIFLGIINYNSVRKITSSAGTSARSNNGRPVNDATQADISVPVPYPLSPTAVDMDACRICKNRGMGKRRLIGCEQSDDNCECAYCA